MKYLLDTSVFSQPLRRKPVEAALLRWRDVADANCQVSRVSIAEVEWGLAVENQAIRWEKYRQLLEHRLSVLETSAEIWSQFSTLKARQQKRGQPVADLDLLIAATAIRNKLTVATLNSRDFSRIEGVAWEDWSHR